MRLTSIVQGLPVPACTPHSLQHISRVVNRSGHDFRLHHAYFCGKHPNSSILIYRPVTRCSDAWPGNESHIPQNAPKCYKWGAEQHSIVMSTALFMPMHICTSRAQLQNSKLVAFPIIGIDGKLEVGGPTTSCSQEDLGSVVYVCVHVCYVHDF